MPAKVSDVLKEARRDRLRELRDSRYEGSNTLLAKALGKQPDYISRAILGRKVIGEGLAREIEAALELPVRWMDGDAIEVVAQGRVMLDAEMLSRSIGATDRWVLLEGARLTPLRRAELVATLYEMFFDRLDTTAEQMVSFLRRQARIAQDRAPGE